MVGPDIKPAQPLAPDRRLPNVVQNQERPRRERPQEPHRPIAIEIPQGHGVLVLAEHHGGPGKGLKVEPALPRSAQVFEAGVGMRGR